MKMACVYLAALLAAAGCGGPTPATPSATSPVLHGQVISMQWVDAPIGSTAVIDWMPDVGLPPALVR